MLLMRWDNREELMYFCNAGHGSIIHYHFNTGEVEKILRRGSILGIWKDVEDTLIEDSLMLEIGDTLVLCTDGVLEAMDKDHELFGEKRLMNIVKQYGNLNSEVLLEVIMDALDDFVRSNEQKDDITLMVIKR